MIELLANEVKVNEWTRSRETLDNMKDRPIKLINPAYIEARQSHKFIGTDICTDFKYSSLFNSYLLNKKMIRDDSEGLVIDIKISNDNENINFVREFKYINNFSYACRRQGKSFSNVRMEFYNLNFVYYFVIEVKNTSKVSLEDEVLKIATKLSRAGVYVCFVENEPCKYVYEVDDRGNMSCREIEAFLLAS
jgi:hypothetical protein